jgi:hypothetical protein
MTSEMRTLHSAPGDELVRVEPVNGCRLHVQYLCFIVTYKKV